ncbi:MAG: hypothetical protein ACJ749_10150 [Flavisolibacter sp.]
MGILRILFYLFLFYMAFKLIFDFIIPVYKTTKRVRRGFKEMQNRMNQHTEHYNGQNVHHRETVKDKKAESGDYIDFEEIK